MSRRARRNRAGGHEFRQVIEWRQMLLKRSAQVSAGATHRPGQSRPMTTIKSSGKH
jgi:hypothetical protein